MTTENATGEQAEYDLEETDLIEELRTAHRRLRSVESEIEDHGESAVKAAANHYRQAIRLLEGYEDVATGTGDFESYLEFRGKFSTMIENLDDDVPRRDAFEAADDAVDRRRLRERDFEAAREALEPVTEVVDLLDQREEKRENLQDVRTRVIERKRLLEEQIEDLDRIQNLGEAYFDSDATAEDLDDAIDEFEGPITAYNEAIRDDFATFRSNASARAFLAFIDRASSSPMVDYRAPPPELTSYVQDKTAGTEPVPTLLTYDDYSNSKLQHYVDDPGALRTRVSVHRTYLEELDAEPLTVAWPPRPALELRYRAEELISVIGQIAADETIARLRDVRDLTRRSDYERLRRAASARTELSDEDRERLVAGDVETERNRLERERDHLANVLAETEP